MIKKLIFGMGIGWLALFGCEGTEKIEKPKPTEPIYKIYDDPLYTESQHFLLSLERKISLLPSHLNDKNDKEFYFFRKEYAEALGLGELALEFEDKLKEKGVALPEDYLAKKSRLQDQMNFYHSIFFKMDEKNGYSIDQITNKKAAENVRTIKIFGENYTQSKDVWSLSVVEDEEILEIAKKERFIDFFRFLGTDHTTWEYLPKENLLIVKDFKYTCRRDSLYTTVKSLTLLDFGADGVLDGFESWANGFKKEEIHRVNGRYDKILERTVNILTKRYKNQPELFE